MDLSLTAFERFSAEYDRAKFGGNLTTNKLETEGGGDTMYPPPSLYNNKIPQH